MSDKPTFVDNQPPAVCADYLNQVAATVYDALDKATTPEQVQNPILEAIFPVGAIWQTKGADDPNDLFPGSWVRIAEGVFLTAAGDGTNPDYALGATGGAEEVTLTSDQIPSHAHSASSGTAGDHAHTNPYKMRVNEGAAPADPVQLVDIGGAIHASNLPANTPFTNTTGDHSHTVTVDAAGGGQPHENRPPYLAVNIWERTG